MIGEIYSIPIQGRRDNFPHLQLVAATAGENNLVIPAFGSDGPELEAALKEFEKFRGCFRHQCSLELDNSKHVKFCTAKTGKMAVWFVGRRNILSTSQIRKHVLEGKMDANGLLRIIECILEWNQTKPDDLSPKIIAAVKAVHLDIEAGRYCIK